MLTYDEARKTLKGRETKKLARNTYLREEPGRMVIKFWDTDIITIDGTNLYTLNSGGYRTLTTKERFNTFTPARIGQERGLWYVYKGRYPECTKLPFADGIQVDSYGEVITGAGNTDMPAIMRKVDRLVSKYIAGYAADVMKNGLPEGTDGDCWGCLMQDVTGKKPEPMGFGHYLSHFEEKYYVPSILFKAMTEANYGNPGFVWGRMKADIEHGREPCDLKGRLRRFFRTRKLGIAEELARRG